MEALQIGGEEHGQEQGQGPEAGVVATMRVHGLVLAQRSGYFHGWLAGGGARMAEGRSKILTVEVEDEQEAADFQRLIKLSYGPSYIEEDGQPLSKEELLRLLVLANGYEMVWCLKDCARALQPFEGYGEALAYFRCVPDSLLNTDLLRSTTKAAGDALAKALGPVEQLWRPGDTHNYMWGKSYLLDPHIVALPVGGIEAVLRSQTLQLKSENYAFSLALWWAMEQEEGKVEVQPLFDRLLKSLRYARMSAVFLASIAQIDWVKDSGIVPSILTQGVWRRGGDRLAYPIKWPSSRVKEADRESYSCTFTTHFTKTAIDALRKSGDRTKAPLALLHGFPCRLELLQKEGGTLALLLFSDFLIKTMALETPGEADLEGQDNDKERGFEYTVVRGTLGVVDLTPNKVYEARVGWAHHILTCPSEALVFDEEGNLKVELELKMRQYKDC